MPVDFDKLHIKFLFVYITVIFFLNVQYVISCRKKHTISCYIINIIETTINKEEKKQGWFYFIFQPPWALITSEQLKMLLT